MDPITVGLIMGGSSFLQSMGKGRAEQARLMAQQKQHDYQEFVRRMENERTNRNIAKQNSYQWMNNFKIAEAANQQRAEEEFYLRLNYSNEGQFAGRMLRSVNDSLASSLQGKGMAKGGTARQLIIQTLNRAKEDTVAKRVSLENALVASERKQTAMLSQRNFGYNTGVPFMPGQLMQMDPSSAFNMHLQQGVISGVASGVSGYNQAHFVQGLGSGAPAAPRFVGPV